MKIIQRWKDSRKSYEQIEAQESLKEACSQLLFKAMEYDDSLRMRDSIATKSGYGLKFIDRVLGGSENITLEQAADLFLACGYELCVELKEQEQDND